MSEKRVGGGAGGVEARLKRILHVARAQALRKARPVRTQPASIHEPRRSGCGQAAHPAQFCWAAAGRAAMVLFRHVSKQSGLSSVVF